MHPPISHSRTACCDLRHQAICCAWMCKERVRCGMAFAGISANTASSARSRHVHRPAHVNGNHAAARHSRHYASHAAQQPGGARCSHAAASTGRAADAGRHDTAWHSSHSPDNGRARSSSAMSSRSVPQQKYGSGIPEHVCNTKENKTDILCNACMTKQLYTVIASLCQTS